MERTYDRFSIIHTYIHTFIQINIRPFSKTLQFKYTYSWNISFSFRIKKLMDDACLYIYIYIRIYMHLFTYIRILTYRYKFTYIYIYIYIYILRFYFKICLWFDFTIKPPDEWEITKQARRDESIVSLFSPYLNIYRALILHIEHYYCTTEKSKHRLPIHMYLYKHSHIFILITFYIKKIY